MGLTAFNIDGREGTHGTIMLTSTTPNAATLINCYAAMSGAGVTHDAEGSSRTMAGACVAGLSLRQQTVLMDSNSMSDADGTFLGRVYFLDGSRGAHFAASGAVGTAETTIKLHLGLHEGGEIL